MVWAMRYTTWRTLVSPRSARPWRPARRKYFDTTMSVASCDHDFGISAPRVANTTEPSGLLITLSRLSYSTAASGSTPAVVYRRDTRPAPGWAGFTLFVAFAGADFVLPFVLPWIGPSMLKTSNSLRETQWGNFYGGTQW